MRIIKAAPLAALGLAFSATPTGAASFSHTVTVPFPVSTPTSYSVTVLDRTVYTPTLTNGQATLTISVSGEPGGPAVQTVFPGCPANRPKPVLSVVLSGGSGTVGIAGSITGTTSDPRTGAPNNVFQNIGFGPQPLPGTGDPVRLVSICSS